MNPVYVDEANVADVDLVPPGSARWRAVHNLHGTALNVLAPSNEIYKYTAEDADARSSYHSPLNSGKLDEDQSILGSTTVTAGTATDSARASGTVTVTRNGVDVTSSVTPPSFNGIEVAAGAATAILVNAEGADLKEGDVITFPLLVDTEIELSITLAEDDLKLGAGLNILKATTMAVACVVPANHIVQLPSFSQIEIAATDGGNDATAVLYFD